MAFTFADVFGSLRANLSRLEAGLVGVIALQSVIVPIVNGIPQLAKYVDGAFALVAVVSLFIKNLLSNISPGGSTPIPGARRTWRKGR
jgi:hypothetical protein